MATSRPNWYEMTERQAYPLAEAGADVPSDLLVDFSGTWDGNAQTGLCYLNQLAVTPAGVVSLVVVDDNGLPILGYAGMPIVHRATRLTSLAANAWGDVTFGSGIRTFRGAVGIAGSLGFPIHSNCGRARGGGVREFQVVGMAGAASGVVDFLAGDPLALDVSGNRISIKAADTSKMSRFAAACGRRSEAGTCLDPQPILRVAGIAPLDTGELTITLEGALTAHPVDKTIVFSSSISLTTFCGG